MQVLTSEQMAQIEGGLVLDLADHCTAHTYKKACVLSIDVDVEGHYCVKIGTCYARYVQVGPTVQVEYYCG